MAVLSDLEPKKVFHYFEEISKIPRGSYHEKEISDYLVAYAKEHGFAYWQDEIYNIVMKVPASQGREGEEPVIMQGHMDMVCEKTEHADIDMDKEGLRLAVDGDFVYAKETTLGGDDGIAVAYMLAIGDDETISHPPLEYIITVSEEVGMDGASAVDLSMLKGHQMLNLDSEEEGSFLCSCAGGLSAVSKLPVTRQNVHGMKKVCIVVDGLSGGHSGCEIHKERGNACILIGRVLSALLKEHTCYVADIQGGKKDNAIPVYAKAIVCIDEKNMEAAADICRDMSHQFRSEYELSDPNISVTLTVSDDGDDEVSVVTASDTEKITALLMMMPNGVMAMSTSVSGLVETSLNLGIMRLEEDNLYLQQAIRSSVTSRKYYIFDKVCACVTMLGGVCEKQGEYPAWEYKTESKVRPKIIALYKKMYNKEPIVEGIHAGLECGLLAGKIENLDCVAMGPDIFDIHTTSERLSISSTKRVYEILIEYLK